MASHPAGVTRVPRAGASSAAPSRAFDDEIVARIRWSLYKGLGAVTLRRVIDRFGSAREALQASPADLPAAARRALRAGETTRSLSDVLAAALGMDVVATGYRFPGFPERLDHLHDPPPLLFLRGDPSILELPAVAVVGSRRASEYGRSMSRRMGEGLAAAGVAVVSGLALGIDGAAHRGALAAGGNTIAVLGCGPDMVHPRSHRRLFGRILKHGLLVSEFLPGESPLPHHFPRRNRLIAALSRAVVVVEAARRSGALITVEHALDIGRDVFGVPGAVDRSQSEGVHGLIREGAGLVTCARDVLAGAGLERGLSGVPAGAPAAPTGLDAGQRAIWDALESGPAHIDVLARRASMDVATVGAALSFMEVRGWVTRAPGLRFSRSAGEPSGKRLRA